MDCTTKKIKVAPNSNSGKGDYPIPADSAHISSNLTLNLKDNLRILMHLKVVIRPKLMLLRKLK